jgi:hypothetical protein
MAPASAESRQAENGAVNGDAASIASTAARIRAARRQRCNPSHEPEKLGLCTTRWDALQSTCHDERPGAAQNIRNS